MPDHPVIEQIMQAIVARLETIAEGATYTFTPVEVVRPTRTGGHVNPRDKLLVVRQDEDPTFNDGEGGPYVQGAADALVDMLQVVEIDIYCIDADNSTTPIDQIANNRLADVWIAMMSDPTLGGLALPESRMLPPTSFPDAQGQFAGVTARFEVSYRTSHSNPRINGVS